MNLSRVRYVLFDAVGTLIEARPGVADVYASLGARFGSRRSASEIKSSFARALAASAAQREDLDEAGERRRWQRVVASVLDDAEDPEGLLFDLLWRHFEQPEHWRRYPDVDDAWRAVIESGREPGIASNFDARLRTVCGGLPPLDACKRLLLSSEIGFAKPDPRYFAAVGAMLQVPPEAILLVGDDLQCDYYGALHAGWHALFLDRDRRHHVPHAITSLEELAALLRMSS